MKKEINWIKKLLPVILVTSSMHIFAQNDLIYPKAIWPDSKGNHIQAHGGGILKMGRTYYWYGEERRQGLNPEFRYVSCYSSQDLVNWKFRGDPLRLSCPANLKDWVLERPKVYFNAKTRKYVMYMHIDGSLPGGGGGYSFASVCVAVSDKATGPFKFIKTFRPLGYESRDIGQFVDDDGTAYLIFEDRPNGFHIARLSEDYLDVAEDVCLIKAPLEGGALVHYKGLYYMLGSALTGWNPNPNKYATAKQLKGPWSEFRDVASPETNTYGSQSTMLLKIAGTKDTTIVFMGDVWKPDAQWDSRYLWMPVEIGNGKLWLPKPETWKINIKTGKYMINSKHK